MLKDSLVGSKKQQLKVERSRSRSLSPGKAKGKKAGKASRAVGAKSGRSNVNNHRTNQNSSLVKNQSKRSLNKSSSQQKANRSSSLPRIGSSIGKQGVPKKGAKIVKDRKEQRGGERSRAKAGSRVKAGSPTKAGSPVKGSPLKGSRVKEGKPVSMPEVPVPGNGVRNDEKEMGLILLRPEHDRIVFKGLEITDPVFDKYLEMISNDNDAIYVMNALPELNSCKKEDESEGRDFVSGRISRLSGIFQNLSVDKILTPAKKVPHYYSGQCGKNLQLQRVVLVTKFKVEVDLGFLQYSLDGDKLTLFRVYVSKIYRRMNYVGFVYLEALRALGSKHPGADRWSIFILEKNVAVHKFFKFLGFHIEQIASESKNRSVEYFQEFSIKKKDLTTVLAAMAK